LPITNIFRQELHLSVYRVVAHRQNWSSTGTKSRSKRAKYAAPTIRSRRPRDVIITFRTSHCRHIFALKSSSLAPGSEETRS